MLLQAIQISLIILAIHALYWEGMLLYRFRYDASPSWVRKPLYECLICMSSVWTIVCCLYMNFWGHINHFADLSIIPLMLMVCGINVILDSVIYYLRNN
jgi:hypothetical protein